MENEVFRRLSILRNSTHQGLCDDAEILSITEKVKIFMLKYVASKSDSETILYLIQRAGALCVSDNPAALASVDTAMQLAARLVFGPLALDASAGVGE